MKADNDHSHTTDISIVSSAPRSFWPPIFAGTGLGLTLLFMFLVTGHGLGANGIFKRMATHVSDWLAPSWTQANGFFHSMLSDGNPFHSWISWEVAGVALGALAASLLGRRFRFTIERGPQVSAGKRLAMAIAGGILAGFGATLARGCTSGLGLSGGATLSVAGFLFLTTFFISGVIVSRWTRRYWQ